jgi:hypothetical protein
MSSAASNGIASRSSTLGSALEAIGKAAQAAAR